jgi:hypothetical protein
MNTNVSAFDLGVLAALVLIVVLLTRINRRLRPERHIVYSVAQAVPLELTPCEYLLLTYFRANPLENAPRVIRSKFLTWYDRNQAPGKTIKEFAAWWYANDWRGRMGQPPTLAQIMELWPLAASWSPAPIPGPDVDAWR